MEQRWKNMVFGQKVLERPEHRGDLRVWSFLGGPGYIIKDGQRVRDVRRDPMCDFLSEHVLRFYDAQIFPESHGREWNKKIDVRATHKAHLESSITIYPVWDEKSAQAAAKGVERDLQFAWDIFNQKLIIVWWYDDLLVGGKLPPEYETLREAMKKEIQITHALGLEEAKRQVKQAMAEYIMTFTS